MSTSLLLTEQYAIDESAHQCIRKSSWYWKTISPACIRSSNLWRRFATRMCRGLCVVALLFVLGKLIMRFLWCRHISKFPRVPGLFFLEWSCKGSLHDMSRMLCRRQIMPLSINAAKTTAAYGWYPPGTKQSHRRAPEVLEDQFQRRCTICDKRVSAFLR